MSGLPRQGLKRFRARAGLTALIVTVVSIGLLVLIYAYEPSANPLVHAKESDKLSPGLFNVGQTLLTTLLGVGLLSLLFEVLLRESYGRDLLRLLNLRSAMVRSGVQHVCDESEFDWTAVLNSPSITIVVRNPAEWLIALLPAIIASCERRATAITILVPDVDGPRFGALADTAGLDATDLNRNIETAVQTAQTQWQSKQPRLDGGSTIAFAAYQALALHDLVYAEDEMVMLMPRAVGHAIGDLPLTVALTQRAADYPSSWLRKTIDGVLTTNAIWAGRA